MPVYEYECSSCAHQLDKLQKISDPSLTECPECGNQSLRKLVSAAGFRLKGSGWYETDFKTTAGKNLVDSGDNNSKKESPDASKNKDSSTSNVSKGADSNTSKKSSD